MKNKCRRTVQVYSAVAAFCMLFGFIYGQFSYGAYSDYMRFMFCVPLAGGTVPFLLVYLSSARFTISRTAYNIWNSGIALLTSGCLIKGIIEISGRTTDYDMIYWISGSIMLLSGAAIQFISSRVIVIKPSEQ